MLTILLAEDDPVQRRTLRRLLENELQVEIIKAADDGEALKHLKNIGGKKSAWR